MTVELAAQNEFFFRKEKGKNTVTLINRISLISPRIQHKAVLLVLRTVLAVEKGKNTVTLINRISLILPRIQHKAVLLVLRTVLAVRF